jgi:hypothetical protein
MPVIPVLGRLKQEDHKFKTSLSQKRKKERNGNLEKIC